MTYDPIKEIENSLTYKKEKWYKNFFSFSVEELRGVSSGMLASALCYWITIKTNQTDIFLSALVVSGILLLLITIVYSSVTKVRKKI